MARRFVDTFYTKVRILCELGKLSQNAVLKIIEPGSISQFLLHVQPLNENKPLPKSDVNIQGKFWHDMLHLGSLTD